MVGNLTNKKFLQEVVFMECEVCGKPIFGKVFRVVIEGTEMKTCRACARFGEGKEVAKAKPKSKPAAKPKRKKSFKPEPLPEVVEDYAQIIRRARERKGLTQEELGMIINEKASVINRLESGRMTPSISIARKLERALEIKLLEEGEEQVDIKFSRGGATELTIGDIIQIKKRGGK